MFSFAIRLQDVLGDILEKIAQTSRKMRIKYKRLNNQSTNTTIVKIATNILLIYMTCRGGFKNIY